MFPPHLTDVIQPPDKALFRALKASFRKKEEHWKRKNHHRAPSHAVFVQLWTDAYVDALTPRNILSGFWSCRPGQPQKAPFSAKKKAFGHVESARLIRNIFWNIVPLSASSTRTSLPALPALVTALMHRKMLRKTLRKTLQQLLLRCQ